MEQKLVPSRRPGRITCVLGFASIVLAVFCIVATGLDVFFPLPFLMGAGALLLPLVYGLNEMNHTGDYYERSLIKTGMGIGVGATVLYFLGVSLLLPFIE